MGKTCQLVICLGLLGCGGSSVQKQAQAVEAKNNDMEVAKFIDVQVNRLKPLEQEANLAWYEASVTGTDPAFKRSEQAQNALDLFFADRDVFAQAKAFRERGGIKDPLVARQLDIVYFKMLGKQVEPELLGRITALQTKVEQAFNTYRGSVNDEPKSLNEIKEMLRTWTDSQQLQQAWEAEKGVGQKVAGPLGELVKLRNEVATRLGFRDFYALSMATTEQDEDKLLAVFDELDQLTREPFLKLKRVVDERLAARLGVPVENLRPWHYQNPFFQRPPDVFKTGLNDLFKEQDTLELCRRFYNSIGLEVDSIIARSDLYDKPGKTPHAFATDIDRDQDIRVLANIVPGSDWQATMVHELGHAVYDQYKDPNLPWLLRGATHALTTEGLAMMLDRVVANPLWAEQLGLLDAKTSKAMMPEARMQLAFASLLFSRWTQVMLHFERELYAKPDQDLNALWWGLVEKYQGLTRPEGRDAPDYASKIHLVVAPVYYHNYMLGELFAAQVHETIAKTTGKSAADSVYVGEEKVGEYLKKEIFSPGASYSWSDLTKKATGETLSPKAFAKRFSAAQTAQ